MKLWRRHNDHKGHAVCSAYILKAAHWLWLMPASQLVGAFSWLWNHGGPSLRDLFCIVWIYSPPAPSQSPISQAPCSRRSIRILLVCSIVNACICNNADPSPGRQPRFPPSLLLTWMQTAADGVKWRMKSPNMPGMLFLRTSWKRLRPLSHLRQTINN